MHCTVYGTTRGNRPSSTSPPTTKLSGQVTNRRRPMTTRHEKAFSTLPVIHGDSTTRIFAAAITAADQRRRRPHRPFCLPAPDRPGPPLNAHISEWLVVHVSDMMSAPFLPPADADDEAWNAFTAWNTTMMPKRAYRRGYDSRSPACALVYHTSFQCASANAQQNCGRCGLAECGGCQYTHRLHIRQSGVAGPD